MCSTQCFPASVGSVLCQPPVFLCHSFPAVSSITQLLIRLKQSQTQSGLDCIPNPALWMCYCHLLFWLSIRMLSSEWDWNVNSHRMLMMPFCISAPILPSLTLMPSQGTPAIYQASVKDKNKNQIKCAGYSLWNWTGKQSHCFQTYCLISVFALWLPPHYIPHTDMLKWNCWDTGHRLFLHLMVTACVTVIWHKRAMNVLTV